MKSAGRKPSAPIPPQHLRKSGDIRSEKNTWCTANNWHQATAAADAAEATAAAAEATASAAVATASAATAAAKAKHKEENFWKPSYYNPVKPFYRPTWPAGTTLDEAIEEEEEEDELDPEDTFKGHCK